MEDKGYLHNSALGPLTRRDCPGAPSRKLGPSLALSSFGRTTSLCPGCEAISQVRPGSLPQPWGGKDTQGRPTLGFRNVAFTTLHTKVTPAHTHTGSQNHSWEPDSHIHDEEPACPPRYGPHRCAAKPACCRYPQRPQSARSETG